MNVAGEWTWPAQWVSVPAPPKAPLSARVVTPKLEPGESYNKHTSIPPSSSVARTLNLTPTASPLPLPPTSPMKKDSLHSFKFPVAGGEHSHDRRSAVIGVKLQKIGQEPASNSFAHFGPVLSGMRSRHSSGAPSTDPRKNLMSPSTMADPLSTPPPAKPVDKVFLTQKNVSISTGFFIFFFLPGTRSNQRGRSRSMSATVIQTGYQRFRKRNPRPFAIVGSVARRNALCLTSQ